MGMIIQNGKIFGGNAERGYREHTLWQGSETPPISGTDITLNDNLTNYDEIVFCINSSATYNQYSMVSFTCSSLEVGKKYVEITNHAIPLGVYWAYTSGTSINIARLSSQSGGEVIYTKIIGIKYSEVVAGTSFHKYSTTERVVGEWIDGRAVYEKTLNVGTVSSGTTFAHGITNLDWIIDYSLFGLYAGEDKLVSPANGSSGSIGFVISTWNSTNITFTKGNLSYNLSDCYCTIRYIKSSS